MAPPVSLPTRVTSSQVEALEQLRDEPRDAAERQVGVLGGAVAVSAEGQGGDDAAVVAGEVGDDVVVQRGVHEQPVHEDDHGARAAGVLVVDGAG